MENVTVVQIGAIVTFAVGLFKGLEFLVDLYKKPTNNLEVQIDRKLDKMQRDINITLETLALLVQHEITGDHSTDMSELHDKLVRHLANRGN